jgi:uncharacterized protein (DUF488 family)
MGQDDAIFTIGYGGRSITAFLDLLERHGILLLVDIRSRPHSRFSPDFSRQALCVHLEERGVAYTYMGAELGGMPEGHRMGDGRIDDTSVRASRPFQDGLRRLASLAGRQRTAVMCAELRPEACHRSRLVGAALAENGIPVRHVDERGGLVSQGAAMRRLTHGQVRLDAVPQREPHLCVGWLF